MRWEEHAEIVGDGKVHTEIWCKNLKDLDIDVRTILNSMFKNQDKAMDWSALVQDRDS